MISFEIDGVQFNYRAAVIMRDEKDRILLHRKGDDQYWTLPGGRCDAVEFSRECAVRELKEEIDVDIKIEKAVFFIENMFMIGEKRLHEIGVYYTAQFDKNNEKYRTEEFYSDEGGKKQLFRWFTWDEIEEIEFQPAPLKERLKNIPEHMEIIEIREAKNK